jgi:hypothetical protein
MVEMNALCAAHTIQLAIKDVEGFWDELAPLAVFVRRVRASGKLREALKNHGAKLELLEDVVTRWGSRLQMLVRLAELKEPVRKLAKEMQPEDDIDEAFLESLQSGEIWDKIDTWKALLDPLQVLTEIVSQENVAVMASLPHLLHSTIAKLPSAYALSKEFKTALKLRFDPWLTTANIGMYAARPAGLAACTHGVCSNCGCLAGPRILQHPHLSGC